MVHSREGKNEIGGEGGPHRWNSFPRLERPGCEADHSPSSSTEVCSSTCAFTVCKGTI